MDACSVSDRSGLAVAGLRQQGEPRGPPDHRPTVVHAELGVDTPGVRLNGVPEHHALTSVQVLIPGATSAVGEDTFAEASWSSPVSTDNGWAAGHIDLAPPKKGLDEGDRTLPHPGGGLSAAAVVGAQDLTDVAAWQWYFMTPARPRHPHLLPRRPVVPHCVEAGQVLRRSSSRGHSSGFNGVPRIRLLP
jgi:hypothetical protein